MAESSAKCPRPEPAPVAGAPILDTCVRMLQHYERLLYVERPGSGSSDFAKTSSYIQSRIDYWERRLLEELEKARTPSN